MSEANKITRKFPGIVRANSRNALHRHVLTDHEIGPAPFRPIHYLGSKLRIVSKIGEIIDRVDPDKGLVCDLFAGSGTVSSYLSYSRPVAAVDIQEYSRVLCSALLAPHGMRHINPAGASELWESELYEKLSWAIAPLKEYEEYCSRLASENNLPLCELVERGSIVGFEQGNVDGLPSELCERLTSVNSRLDKLGYLDGPEATITRYYGGLYFSYEQAVQLDVLLSHVAEQAHKVRDVLLAAVLSTASDVVNTIGNQFAQPMRPRNSSGKPKSNIHERILRDREADVFTVFQSWRDKYISRPKSRYANEAYRMDYLEALDSIGSRISVIYADPPYTRDHYSRFYHVLETMCLRDNPKLSRGVSAGKNSITRGVYRDGRHQSPFCIKSRAPTAFEDMFEKAKNLDASLVISYSPYDTTKKSHPRLVTIEQLRKLATKYYARVSIESLGPFSHSKLNKAERNFGITQNAELVIICES